MFLKITKPDKTVHAIPLSNEAFWKSYNNKLKDADKVKLEYITEEEAKNVAFRDEDYVTGADAQKKVTALQKESAEKDAENAALKAQIEAMQEKLSQAHSVGLKVPPTPSSQELSTASEKGASNASVANTNLELGTAGASTEDNDSSSNLADPTNAAGNQNMPTTNLSSGNAATKLAATKAK